MVVWEEGTYLRKTEQLKVNLIRAQGLIWKSYMTTEMQDKIQQHPEYTTKLEQDPVELLKAIKEMMHKTIRLQNTVMTKFEAMKKMLNFRQEGKSNAEYLRQFKELRDVCATQNRYNDA